MYAWYSDTLVPVMTDYTEPEGEVIHSGSVYTWSGVTYHPWRLFHRGVEISTWVTSKTTGWVGYIFTKPTRIRKYSIKSNSNNLDRQPKNWTFQGSNDGITWDTLDIRENITWEASTFKGFDIENNKYYTRYRLNITANNGNTGYIQFAQLEMYDAENDRYLIKLNNKIYSITSEGDLIETSLEEPLTKQSYADYGIDDLTLINSTKLNQLEEFEILAWTDNLEKIPKLELTVSEYKPILILHEPEIVTMTDIDNPLLHIEGFRNLIPYCESENPHLLILSQSKPNIYTDVIPNSQLILPKGDIQFKMLDKVLSFNMTATEQDKGLIRIIFSVDSGDTWKVYDESIQDFKEIDIQNLDVVGNEGMTTSVFNSIGTKWNEVVQNNKIRFGYYLKIDELNDVANVDKLEVTIDVLGSWDATLHEIDYNYEYDNEKIYIELYRDGSYKINYI